MKKAIWGTGIFASRFYSSFNNNEIDFFVDSDNKKRGNSFYGKKILMIDEIDDWEKIYFYIPYNYYEDIVKILKKNNLVEGRNYERYYGEIQYNKQHLDANYDECMERLKQIDWNLIQENSCVLFGSSWYYQHKRILKELRHSLRNNIILFVEDGNSDLIKDELAIEVYELPLLCGERVICEMDNDDYDSHEVDFVYDVPYLHNCCEQLRAYKNVKCPEYFIAKKFICLDYIVKRMTPSIVILDTSLFTKNIILEHLFVQKNIKVLFIHPGVLPGTTSIDCFGEMGKSLPAIQYDKFKKLPIDSRDKKEAEIIWEYMFTTKENRKVQPYNKQIGEIIEKFNNGKKTVVFIGANDPLSHMVPYTNDTQKYHSPIFKTSIEAALYVEKICNENGYNYLYKPHPNYVPVEGRNLFCDSTEYIEFGDINDIVDMADVVVTILSQTAYVALTRKKPVLMLGYIQLRGQEIAYEAYRIDEVKIKLLQAMREGFTLLQRDNFISHIARLCKYYLYTDTKERDIIYGKKIPDNVNGFFDLKHRLDIID